MAIEWTVNRGDWGFGQDDYDQLVAQGFDASKISQFLNDNKRYFGYGRMNVAPSVRSAVGLNDEWSNAGGGVSTDLRRQGSKSSYEQYLKDLKETQNRLKTEQDRDEKLRLLEEEKKKVEAGTKQVEDLKKKEGDFLLADAKVKDLEKQVADFQAVRDELSQAKTRTSELESNAKALQQQLDTAKSEYETSRTAAQTDFERRFGEARADYDKRFNEAKAGYESTISAKDKDLAAAKTLAESYKSDLNRYRETEVAAQLSGLRSGSSGSGGGASGFEVGSSAGSSSLRSGRAALSSGSSGSGPQVVVNADDSVVNRKGPVVQLIGGGAARRSAAIGAAPALASGPGGGGYYARRFG